MSYYVVFHPYFGDLQGISTMSPSNVNEGYVVEEFEGDLPKNLDLWDKVEKKFQKPSAITVTKLQFISKFTMAERIILRTEAETDPILADIFKQLELAEEIDLRNQDTINSVYYIASKGYINSTRVNEILEI